MRLNGRRSRVSRISRAGRPSCRASLLGNDVSEELGTFPGPNPVAGLIVCSAELKNLLRPAHTLSKVLSIIWVPVARVGSTRSAMLGRPPTGSRQEGVAVDSKARHRAVRSVGDRLDRFVRRLAFLVMLATVGYVTSFQGGPLWPTAPVVVAAPVPEPTAAQAEPIDAVTQAEPRARYAVSEGSVEGPLPAVAHAAYVRAADVLNDADRRCHLDWQLLAGAGWVEGRHGRWGVSAPNADGVVTPAMFGVVTSRVDSDHGQLDASSSVDRTVGPFQFSPARWVNTGVDGDGDGLRDPQDLDDAALAFGVVLCAGRVDLRDGAAVVGRLGELNSVEGYATAVQSAAAHYRANPAVEEVVVPVFEVVQDGAMPSPTASASPSESPSPSASAPLQPTAKPSSTPTIKPVPTPKPSPAKPTASVSPTPSSSPVVSPSAMPSTSSSAG